MLATKLEVFMEPGSEIELIYTTAPPEAYLIQNNTLYFGYNYGQPVTQDYRILFEFPYYPL